MLRINTDLYHRYIKSMDATVYCFHPCVGFARPLAIANYYSSFRCLLGSSFIYFI